MYEEEEEISRLQRSVKQHGEDVRRTALTRGERHRLTRSHRGPPRVPILAPFSPYSHDHSRVIAFFFFFFSSSPPQNAYVLRCEINHRHPSTPPLPPLPPPPRVVTGLSCLHAASGDEINWVAV